MKVLHAAVFAALTLAFSASHGAGLNISQFAYRSPDLLVFVDRGNDAPALGSLDQLKPTVAWGATVLDTKTAATWNVASGIAVVVAFDVSGSMKSVDFPAIQRAVMDALTALPSTSRAALLTIGLGVNVPVPFGPVAAVTGAVEALQPNEPETALNEGILRAQTLASQDSPDLPLRRMVLLVTDGVDESKSAIGTDEMRAEVRGGSAPIFMAAVTRGLPAPGHSSGLEPLASVARASGGDFVQTTPRSLPEDLAQLISAAEHVDLIAAACSVCVREGTVRTLQVALHQGQTVLSGVRDVRLLAEWKPPAEPVPVPAPPASTAIDPPDKPSWLANFKFNVELVMPWRFFLALLALCIPATAAGGYVYRNRIIVLVHRIWFKKSDSDTRVISEGETTRQDRSKPVQLTLDVEGVGRQEVEVGASDMVLGRSKKANVSAEKDTEASNQHAALYIDKGVLMVRDLDSRNGTLLNGTRIVRPEPIRDRDVVHIGRTDVRVYFGKL